MKWVNPPVAFMLHAGVPLLLQAGVHLPGLHAGDETRVAVEGYPGLLARELLGHRSYKSDDKAKQTPERLIARKDLLEALEQGRTRLGLRLKLSAAQRDALADDASGDALDAVLCLVQAAWAAQQPGWGLPAGVEYLDMITPQYIADLVSWGAIGARTTESQTHREMSSGLSSPVGFKNGTDGGLKVATNALLSVQNPHSFLGIDNQGKVAVINTTGNQYGHVVLRGGDGKPNYDSVSVALAERELEKAKAPMNIMIDASHANSNKDPALQPLVMDNVANQIVEGNKSIIGMMIESHIKFGRQDIPKDLSQLVYGQSVTDGCIDWDTTEKAVLSMHAKLKDVLPTRR